MATTKIHQLRLAELQDWGASKLRQLGRLKEQKFHLESASDDASFRRYFRGVLSVDSYILVDAPPDKEDNRSFVDINQRLAAAGVFVPEVLAYDFDAGYLLLTDLGDRLLLPELQDLSLNDQEQRYRHTLETLKLVRLANCDGLPVYDADRLQAEMDLFPEWFLDKQLGLTLSVQTLGKLREINQLLIENALAQPQVFVHRDFHSRNLMPQDDGALGVIDFQDGVMGPITYDLVSLLKDCYWKLPRANVIEIVEAYRLAVLPEVARGQFVRWFDLMGFQRHLKCAGIFSRLNIRDGKSRYLDDVPLVIDYLLEVASLYPELERFGEWLDEEIKPAMKRRLK